MYISKLEIMNYRNIHNSTIKLEDGLNVIVGPNNSGKSNILNVINFLYTSPKQIQSIHDINKNYLVKKYNDHLTDPPFIKVKFHIEHLIDFNVPDSAFNKLNKFMIFNDCGELDASEDEKYIIKAIIEMRYELDSLFTDSYKKAMEENAPESYKDFFNILERYKENYEWTFYNVSGVPVEYKYVKNIFEIEMIEANRNVDEISNRSRNYAAEKISTKQDDTLKLKDQINKNMKDTFSDIVDSINSEIAEDQENIGIIDGNNRFVASFEFDSDFTSFFKYELEDNQDEYGYGLPMKNNGLGFNNLIHIRNIIKQKKANDYNILLIEEPESHLHPNMQYKLLKYISNLRAIKTTENEQIRHQIVVSTHSPNITASTPIENMVIINYVREGEISNVVSIQGKDNFDSKKVGEKLSIFEKDEFSDEEQQQNEKLLKEMSKRLQKSKNHLHKFLDVTRSDFLFASKVILVEGIAEKLLLPSMAIALGKEKDLINNHISIIEVGGIQFNHFLPMLIGLERKCLCLCDCDYKHWTEDNTLKSLSEYSMYLNSKRDNLIAEEYNKCAWVKTVTQKNLGNTFETELFLENFENQFSFKYLMESIEAPKCLDFLLDNQSIESWKKNVENISNENTRNKIEKILNQYYKVYEKAQNLEEKTIVNKLFFSEVFYSYVKGQKGDFALKLAIDNFKELKVPEYIKEGIEWLFQ